MDEKRIPLETFKGVEMLVGEIEAAERVPDTDKLLRLAVNLGEANPRQIISGIAEYFPEPASLVGKRCVFVANLEPRMIRGQKSDGMILAAAEDDDSFALLVPEGAVPVGARVR